MLRPAAILLTALPAWAEPVSVPSGQPIEYLETLRDTAGPYGLTLRMRFVAPEIGTLREFDDVEDDILYLCQTLGLRSKQDARQIVISLSDRAIEFGATDPEATQFFEAFRVEDGECVPELF